MPYNLSMDIKTLSQKTDVIWQEFCEIYPKLVRFDPPKMVLCNRLTRTIGKNYYWENRIHLANKFFNRNEKFMLAEILPHELAHQIHFNLYGQDSVTQDCHGKEWAEIMLSYGLFPHITYNISI